MRTVHEVSKLTGISIRTLQYYDRIGLLPASDHTHAGYRLYDDKALQQLQQILLFRALAFPLKDIRQILSSPDFDRQKALQQQIELLTLQKEHIENLIALARGMTVTGENTMDFSAFNTEKLDRYAEEAKKIWGHSEAYRQFAEKSQSRNSAEEAALGQGLMAIFTEIGKLRQEAPDSQSAQALVQKLQSYITDHYYPCTSQILMGLGQMYAAGGEFTENIDAAGGPGTAAFTAAAIRIHCSR